MESRNLNQIPSAIYILRLYPSEVHEQDGGLFGVLEEPEYSRKWAFRNMWELEQILLGNGSYYVGDKERN